jgi:hypothetical protein
MFFDIQLCEKRRRRYAVEKEELIMREILGWIDMFFVNLLGLGLVLLVITVVLAIIAVVLEMIFGGYEPATKNSQKASIEIPVIPCNHNRNTTDEAQRCFMGDHIRSHEDGVRLHDMAAREAWDAHSTACDQHQAAVDMHNDLSFAGCDPWF